LVVAAKEGIVSSDIRKLTGIAQPTISRALGDLGDWAQKKNAEGLKLIKTERDPNDLRNVQCFLTAKGKLLAARIAQLMGIAEDTVDPSFPNGNGAQ
ncbi:MarR family winged helix-turn-helix transcriptional regulator, partial [Escherichia coli]